MLSSRCGASDLDTGNLELGLRIRVIPSDDMAFPLMRVVLLGICPDMPVFWSSTCGPLF